MRTEKEIRDKIEELYELAAENKRDSIRVIVETDALEWVLGEDYLDTDQMVGNEDEEK